jgi:hypothetical protein
VSITELLLLVLLLLLMIMMMILVFFCPGDFSCLLPRAVSIMDLCDGAAVMELLLHADADFSYIL